MEPASQLKQQQEPESVRRNVFPPLSAAALSQSQVQAPPRSDGLELKVALRARQPEIQSVAMAFCPLPAAPPQEHQPLLISSDPAQQRSAIPHSVGAATCIDDRAVLPQETGNMKANLQTEPWSPVVEQAPAKPASLPESVQRTLDVLRSHRRKRSDPYIDCSCLPQLPPPSASKQTSGRKHGGDRVPFPEKVYRMLCQTSPGLLAAVVSFAPHGRSFHVHDIDRFVAEVLPVHFEQTKWSSFTRQLNLWGFRRIIAGHDCGGFYHELLLRGRPDLCCYMTRVGRPGKGVEDGSKKKNGPRIAKSDPNFYAMTPMK